MKYFLYILYFLLTCVLQASPIVASPKLALQTKEHSYSTVTKENKDRFEIFKGDNGSVQIKKWLDGPIVEIRPIGECEILLDNGLLETRNLSYAKNSAGEWGFVNTAGKIFNSIDEAVLSKIDDITKRVYRGDSRLPNEIFADGFKAKGTNTDIVEYVEMNTPSIFIGTSKSPQQALNKAFTSQSDGYVYMVSKKGQMTDVNSWYTSIEGYQNPFFSELEVVFENAIPSSNIQGAFRINSQGEVIGDLIPNPNYVP
jgi:hypothetical protein